MVDASRLMHGRCMEVDAWSMHGRCMVDAWSMHGRCMANRRSHVWWLMVDGMTMLHA